MERGREVGIDEIGQDRDEEGTLCDVEVLDEVGACWKVRGSICTPTWRGVEGVGGGAGYLCCCNLQTEYNASNKGRCSHALRAQVSIGLWPIITSSPNFLTTEGRKEGRTYFLLHPERITRYTCDVYTSSCLS